MVVTGNTLILIEAKGVTGWSNAQIESKFKRLELCFNRYPIDKLGIQVAFVLMSPSKGQPPHMKVLNDDGKWPKWAFNQKTKWIPMSLLSEHMDDFYRVTRVDFDEDSNSWRSWEVKKVKKSVD